MSKITTEEIKALRDATGVSVMQCKKALEEVGGDMAKAKEVLKEISKVTTKKKAERSLEAGVVSSYIHQGSAIGSMVEFLCETDFVAKNKEFMALAREIAMHIAAMDPQNTEELLKQEFIKDPGVTIGGIIEGATQKFGERTEVGQFVRYSIK
jgi:elongation factor Ts